MPPVRLYEVDWLFSKEIAVTSRVELLTTSEKVSERLPESASKLKLTILGRVVSAMRVPGVIGTILVPLSYWFPFISATPESASLTNVLSVSTAKPVRNLTKLRSIGLSSTSKTTESFS